MILGRLHKWRKRNEVRGEAAACFRRIACAGATVTVTRPFPQRAYVRTMRPGPLYLPCSPYPAVTFNKRQTSVVFVSWLRPVAECVNVHTEKQRPTINYKGLSRAGRPAPPRLSPQPLPNLHTIFVITTLRINQAGCDLLYLFSFHYVPVALCVV